MLIIENEFGDRTPIWFEEVSDLLFKRMTHNIVLMIYETCFVALDCVSPLYIRKNE